MNFEKYKVGFYKNAILIRKTFNTMHLLHYSGWLLLTALHREIIYSFVMHGGCMIFHENAP